MLQKINIIITIIFILLTTSCGKNNKQNFDVDLSDFKIPSKSTSKILNPKETSTSSLENKIIKKNLLTYKTKSEVLNSVEIGKKDPFSNEEIAVNTLNIDLKLTGFLNTQNIKYAFVSYLDNEGTLTENSIGGINTNLLPKGAKVVSINPKNKKLIINYEKKSFVYELKDI